MNADPHAGMQTMDDALCACYQAEIISLDTARQRLNDKSRLPAT